MSQQCQYPIRHKVSGVKATCITEWAGWGWAYKGNGTTVDQLFTFGISDGEWEAVPIEVSRSEVFFELDAHPNQRHPSTERSFTSSKPVGVLIGMSDGSVRLSAREEGKQ